MSAFLGPIHYWLYNKIGLQEELTAALAGRAANEGWIPSDEATDYSVELPALESVIDEGNIHGWLQARIADAETRYAELVGEVLAGGSEGDGSSRMSALLDEAFAFGCAHALPAEADAMQAYRAFDDFFVNGMPCDRVNVITANRPECVAWEMRQDIHAPYWQPQGTHAYYALRTRVMEGMLGGTKFAVTVEDDFHYTISAR